MGGHNDNGNSNGPHEDVSRIIGTKIQIITFFGLCVYMCTETRVPC